MAAITEQVPLIQLKKKMTDLLSFEQTQEKP